jgi:3-oxoadipate enol-lactonase
MPAFVRLGSVVHHVRIDGPADAPVVLFANSLGTDLRIWDEVVARLRGSVRAIRYDMRGHGLTAAADPPYSIEDLADDAERLLDAFGVERATVCGLSVGGMVALLVAARRPEQMRSVLLCDTGYRIGAAEMWNARIASVTQSGIAAISESVVSRWLSDRFRSAHPDDTIGYRSMVERVTPAGYAGVCAALRDADLESVARALRCPTRVVCGADDQATPPSVNEALAAAIPGATFELIPNAAHLTCVEQPSIIAAQIASLLKQRH